MNERVKELWEEATVSTWPRPGKFTAGEYDYHLKKFTELIVKECVNSIPLDMDHVEYLRVMRAIKNTFRS